MAKPQQSSDIKHDKKQHHILKPQPENLSENQGSLLPQIDPALQSLVLSRKSTDECAEALNACNAQSTQQQLIANEYANAHGNSRFTEIVAAHRKMSQDSNGNGHSTIQAKSEATIEEASEDPTQEFGGFLGMPSFAPALPSDNGDDTSTEPTSDTDAPTNPETESNDEVKSDTSLPSDTQPENKDIKESGYDERPVQDETTLNQEANQENQNTTPDIDPNALADETRNAAEQNVSKTEEEATNAQTEIENALAEEAEEEMPSIQELIEPDPNGFELPEVSSLEPIEFSSTTTYTPPDFASMMSDVPQTTPSNGEIENMDLGNNPDSMLSAMMVGDTSSAETNPQPEETIMRKPLFSPPPPLIQRSEEDEENEQSDYDPQTARATVQALAEPLNGVSGGIEQQIQGEANNVKTTLNTTSDTICQTIEATVTQSVARTQAAFATQRQVLQTMLQTALSDIDTALQDSISDATEKGEDAKTRLNDLFDTHKTNVETAVTDSIAKVEELRTQRRTEAGQKIQEKADDALRRGEEKAGSYSSDERGQKQAEAVRKVAEEVASEIQAQKPDVEQSIDEITEDIPQEFEQKGQETFDGFDNNLPDLLKQIDEQVKFAITSLEQKASTAKQQVQTQGQQLNVQLDAQEQTALTGLQALLPQATAKTNGLLQTLITPIDGTVQQTVGQISQSINEAYQTLLGIETPDVEASQTYVNQIMSFASTAPESVMPMFQQLSTQGNEQFTELQTTTDTEVLNLETQSITQLETTIATAQQSITEIVTKTKTDFETVVTGLDTPFAEFEAKADSELTDALTKLKTDFQDTITKADGEILKAIDAGLAKTNEALAQLDGKMNEAAEDAAWRYDHPTLAKLKDIGSFVVGLVGGILLVLAIVVVAIVAFNVIIAGLVALGLSSAVATLIVTVVGLGLLGFGIYQAYQTRIANGEEGGWSTFGSSVLDVVGVNDVIKGFTDPNLSPLERGFFIGKGTTSVATIFFGGKINNTVRGRLPTSITNPVRGSLWTKLGIGKNQSGGGGSMQQWLAKATGIGKSKEAINASKSYFRNVSKEIFGSGPRPKQNTIIDGKNFTETMELHHRFIPQRWKWIPKQIKHHKWNLEKAYTLEHAQKDSYRFRFLPKWVKEALNK